jgi:hypothetical protein
LELRGVEWRKVLRGPHIKQARLVLQHLTALPMVITNQPLPKHIKKGDLRGSENVWKWSGSTRPGGLLVGVVQSMAFPTGFGAAGALQRSARKQDSNSSAVVVCTKLSSRSRLGRAPTSGRAV